MGVNFKKFLPGSYLNNDSNNTVHCAVINLLISIFTKVDDDLSELLLQLCITTASDVWLDEWGNWFGVIRKLNETDQHYSERILKSVKTHKATIPALKQALIEYLNEKYNTELTLDDIVIVEPYNNILKFSSKSGLFSCTRFRYADATYYRYGVIDIQSPREIDNEMRKIIELTKAAGIKVHYTVVDNLTYGVPVKMFSDNEPIGEQYLSWLENNKCRNTLGAKIFSGYSYLKKELFSGLTIKTSNKLDYIIDIPHYNLNWTFPSSPVLKLEDIATKDRPLKEVVPIQYEPNCVMNIVIPNKIDYAPDDIEEKAYNSYTIEIPTIIDDFVVSEVSNNTEKLLEVNNYNLDWFNKNSPVIRISDLYDNEHLPIPEINKIQSQSSCEVVIEYSE